MSALGHTISTGSALSSPRRHVTKDLSAIANEDNTVPGRIATIPFDLGIGNCKSLSIFDVRAIQWYVVAWVSDDGDILVALHFITVGPISICHPAAGQVWLVWSHQPTEPLAM